MIGLAEYNRLSREMRPPALEPQFRHLCETWVNAQDQLAGPAAHFPTVLVDCPDRVPGNPVESGRDDAPGLALLDHAGDLVLHHHDLGGLEQDDRDGLNRAAVVCDGRSRLGRFQRLAASGRRPGHRGR